MNYKWKEGSRPPLSACGGRRASAIRAKQGRVDNKAILDSRDKRTPRVTRRFSGRRRAAEAYRLHQASTLSRSIVVIREMASSTEPIRWSRKTTTEEDRVRPSERSSRSWR